MTIALPWRNKRKNASAMTEENAIPAPGGDAGKIVIAAIVWTAVGVLWFLLQFLLSEGLYRASDLAYSSNEELGDRLVDVSDAIAWPAGKIYDRKLFEQVESEYRRALSDEALDAPAKENLEALVRENRDTIDNYDLIGSMAEILAENESYVGFDYLSTPEEYSIYLGVCLAWGAAVGVLGFLISVLMIKSGHG